MLPADSLSETVTRAWIATRVDSEARPRVLEAFERVVREVPAGFSPGIVLFFEDNAAYAGAFLAAFSRGVTVWCASPKWTDSARDEARALIPVGARVFGSEFAWAGEASMTPASGGVYIPTGGTGGALRFVRHSFATLFAAVSGFSEHAGRRLLGRDRPARLHAVQALPCHHVSGLMPVVRAFLTDAELVFTPPSFRDETPLPPLPDDTDGLVVVSLVNAQLHRLLERADGPAWMRRAGLILVGGSAVTPELLERARAARVPVGVSYGLTEAPALAALYPPEAFFRGDHPVAGEVLPHLRASITESGRIRFSGTSLGEDVPRDATGGFVTGDEGYFDDAGRLVVTGRADRILVTGGEKVDPTRVESALRATGRVREALVVGEPDAEWGRRLVAVYTVSGDEPGDEAVLAEAIRARLGPVFVPRRWLRVGSLPLDARGKLDHEALRRLLAAVR